MDLLGLLGIFRKKGNSENDGEEEKWFVKELEKYVGKGIEVHRISCGKSMAPEIAVLRDNPGPNFFYIGNETGFHIVHWNYKDSYGLHAVRLIKGVDGETIYENNQVPYEYTSENKDQTSRLV